MMGNLFCAPTIHGRYIEERIAQGRHCPRQIWREVRQRGFTGSRATVQTYVAGLLSHQGGPTLVSAPVRTMPCPSARRAFGWLVGWRKLAVKEPKNVDHERFVQALCQIEPVVAEVRKNKTDPVSRWAVSVQERRGYWKAVVAIAAKNARMCWAMLQHGDAFKLPA